MIGIGIGIWPSPSLSKGGGKRLWNFEAGDVGPFESFARTGAGTAFTAAGLLVSFASGAPRVTDKGLLLEGASSNYLARGRQLDSSVWFKNGCSVVANAGMAPDGNQTADLEVPSGGGSEYKSVQQQISAGVPSTCVVAMFFKPAGYKVLNFIWAGSIGRVALDVETGAFASYGAANISVLHRSQVAQGFWFVAFGVVNAIKSGVWFGAHSAVQDPLTSWSGDGASGAQIWQADIQGGVTIKSPVEHDGSSAVITRGADSAALKVPAGCTSWEAVYGDARTVASGSGLTPGASFDLVTARPWIGLGNELKSVRFAP